MWLPHSIPKGEGEGKLQRLWLKSINAPNQHLPSTMDHHHPQWATLCSDLLDLLGRFGLRTVSLSPFIRERAH